MPETKKPSRMLHTLGVTIAISLVCALCVSTATLVLRPIQAVNQARFKKINILQAADLYHKDISVAERFQNIKTKVVDLATGEYAALDPDTIDPEYIRNDPLLSVPIAPALDIAGIQRRPKFMPVYLYPRDGPVQKYILPIFGYGLWSTMHAFVVLNHDLRTIEGVSFYAHGETPGLGGEIENPIWQSRWKNKEVFDAQNQYRLRVRKGAVDPAAPDAIHQVDGISGATMTTSGVDNMLRFWMGRHGYGPYIKRMRAAARAEHERHE